MKLDWAIHTSLIQKRLSILQLFTSQGYYSCVNIITVDLVL